MEKIFFIDVSRVLNTNESKHYKAKVEIDTFILRATEVRGKELEVDILIEPVSSLRDNTIIAKGNVTGTLVMTCHRCVESFEHPLNITFDQLFSENVKKYEESKIIENNKIDILPVIKESLSLKLPIKILCSEDCRGLCPSCGKNLNKEPCLCINKPVDVRWQKLGDYFKEGKK